MSAEDIDYPEYYNNELVDLNSTLNSTFHTVDNVSKHNSSVPISIPFLPFGFGILVVTLLGILGNFLSALVLCRRHLQSSYSVLTLSLTFVDTVYLITKLIRYGLHSLFAFWEIVPYYTTVFLPLLGPYLRPITFTAHTASTYFIMAIALDRYFVIRWPIVARQLCTRGKAHLYAFIVYFFAIAYNIPRWLEFRTVQQVIDKEHDGNTHSVQYVMEISELRECSDYKTYYIFWSYFVFMFVIPFTSLTCLNVSIWRGIKHTYGIYFTQSREKSFSRMLMGVVLLFIICNLDYLVLDLMDYFGYSYPEVWHHFGNFLLTLNSAGNFIIYCVCGWKFREELTKMLNTCCCFICRRGKTGSKDLSGTRMEIIKNSSYIPSQHAQNIINGQCPSTNGSDNGSISRCSMEVIRPSSKQSNPSHPAMIVQMK